MRVTRLAAVLSLTAGLGGCGGAAPTAASAPRSQAGPAEPASSAAPVPAAPAAVGQEATASRKPDEPPAGSSAGRLMQAHFTDALLIRRAVIAGTPHQAA